MEKHYGIDKDLNFYFYTNKYKDGEMKLYRIEKEELPKIEFNNQTYNSLDHIPNKKEFMEKIKKESSTLPDTEQLRIERNSIPDLSYYINEMLTIFKEKDWCFCKDKYLQIKGVDIIALVKDFKGNQFFICFDAKATNKYITRSDLFFELFQNCQNSTWQLGSALTRGICKYHYLMFPDKVKCYLIPKDNHNISILQEASVTLDQFFQKDMNATYTKENHKYCLIMGEERNREVFEKLHRIVFNKNITRTKERDKNTLLKTFENVNMINDRLEKIKEQVKEIVTHNAFNILSEEQKISYSFIYNDNDTIEDLAYKIIMLDMIENKNLYYYQYLEDCRVNKEIRDFTKYLDTENLARYFAKKLIMTYLLPSKTTVNHDKI